MTGESVESDTIRPVRKKSQNVLCLVSTLRQWTHGDADLGEVVPDRGWNESVSSFYTRNQRRVVTYKYCNTGALARSDP